MGTTQRRDFAKYCNLVELQRNIVKMCFGPSLINPLTPNDHYSGRTAPLTSERCILYICSTDVCTECFKHGI